MGLDYEDIEDLGPIDNSSIRLPNKNIRTRNGLEIANNSESDFGQNAQLPGNQRVWLKTFGCSHNVM